MEASSSLSRVAGAAIALISGVLIYRLGRSHERRLLDSASRYLAASIPLQDHLQRSTSLTVSTYNVWKGGGIDGVKGKPTYWPYRRPALVSTFRRLGCSVLLLQESHPEFLSAAQEALPNHLVVAKDDSFDGWRHEGSILYDGNLLEEVENGFEDINCQEPLRRLFWARFRIKGNGQSVLIATAHFTWQGHEIEVCVIV